MALELEAVELMEPMLPAAGNRLLEDLAADLMAKSSALTASLNPSVAHNLGELVRSMNCYYSNLIEGHKTHPLDIDRALANDLSEEPKKRSLQLEAKAHIEVQRLIDRGQDLPDVVSAEEIAWIHREFGKRLPPDLLYIENPQTGKRVEIVPGEWQTSDVIVGRHIPISAPAIPKFLRRFAEAYQLERLSKIQRSICRRGNSGGKVAETLFSFAARGAVGWCFRSGKSGGNYGLQRTASEVGFERFS
jgi:hypothetical protein